MFYVVNKNGDRIIPISGIISKAKDYTTCSEAKAYMDMADPFDINCNTGNTYLSDTKFSIRCDDKAIELYDSSADRDKDFDLILMAIQEKKPIVYLGKKNDYATYAE